jgi:4'-phosphopantetheinyl transferase EntD
MSPHLDPRLASELSNGLGVHVLVAVAREPAPDDALSAAERARLETFATDARRTEWRLGRAALKAVLRATGASGETAGVVLPHPSLSLTHSGGIAVAVALEDAGAAGVGVDLERERAPRTAMARFFLSEDEEAHARPADLLRLWTIKEAVFKADLENAGTTYRHYAVGFPAARGAASRESNGSAIRFAYATAELDGGPLCVARRLLEEDEACH